MLFNRRLCFLLSSAVRRFRTCFLFFCRSAACPFWGLTKDLRRLPVNLWWISIFVPYSNWFHLQIHGFVHSVLQIRTLLLKAVVMPKRTLSVKKIWGYERSAWWEWKMKPIFSLINHELDSPLEMSGFLMASLTNKRSHVGLPSRFLMNPRLMIWHWHVNQECNRWMPRWTDSACHLSLHQTLSAIEKSTFALSFHMK